MLYTIIGMLVIILDQGVKMLIDKTINYTNTSIDVIPGVLSLVRVQNDGAAFSFLAGGGARIWFIALTLIFTVIVVIALVTNFISGKFGRWCMVLVTAGGLSNCLDRVLYGFVIDMFKIELFDFAVFNVADIFITVFCIAFIIYILFGGEKETDPDEEDEFFEDEEEEDRPKRTKKVKKDKYANLYEENDDDDYPVKSKKSRKAYDEDNRDLRSSRSRKSSGAYYDEEFDYEEPVSRKSSRKLTKPVDYDDDDRFEEMFGSRKVSGSKKKTAPERKTSRKIDDFVEDTEPVSRGISRRVKVSDYYEEDELSAKKSASNKQPSAKSVPSPERKRITPKQTVSSYDYDESDPFAEWERANSVAHSTEYSNYTEEKSVTKPFRKTVEEAVREELPKSQEDDIFNFSTSASSFEDDFDLDSILNEFK